MNAADNARWQDRLLDQVFAAIAAHPALTEILIFKGARILAHHLPGVTRQSLDLDANCRRAFLDTFIDRERQAAVLHEYLAEAVNAHFEAQSPVTLELGEIRVFTKPPKGHPRGWNAFEVRIRVVDRSRPSQLGVPTLELDVASPEAMSADSLTTLQVGGHAVHTYSLPRIAGEKVRAFLSSLPDYQRKSGRSGGAIRVKDLYDLTQVVRHRPLLDTAFWRTAASACLDRKDESSRHGLNPNRARESAAVADRIHARNQCQQMPQYFRLGGSRTNARHPPHPPLPGCQLIVPRQAGIHVPDFAERRLYVTPGRLTIKSQLETQLLPQQLRGLQCGGVHVDGPETHSR